VTATDERAMSENQVSPTAPLGLIANQDRNVTTKATTRSAKPRST
jgi:hypothetical protein